MVITMVRWKLGSTGVWYTEYTVGTLQDWDIALWWAHNRPGAHETPQAVKIGTINICPLNSLPSNFGSLGYSAYGDLVWLMFRYIS